MEDFDVFSVFLSSRRKRARDEPPTQPAQAEPPPAEPPPAEPPPAASSNVENERRPAAKRSIGALRGALKSQLQQGGSGAPSASAGSSEDAAVCKWRAPALSGAAAASGAARRLLDSNSVESSSSGAEAAAAAAHGAASASGAASARGTAAAASRASGAPVAGGSSPSPGPSAAPQPLSASPASPTAAAGSRPAPSAPRPAAASSRIQRALACLRAGSVRPAASAGGAERDATAERRRTDALLQEVLAPRAPAPLPRPSSRPRRRLAWQVARARAKGKPGGALAEWLEPQDNVGASSGSGGDEAAEGSDEGAERAAPAAAEPATDSAPTRASAPRRRRGRRGSRWSWGRARGGAAASVPAAMNAHLREYQREGVRWLYGRYAAGRGGILADDMGLGKTVQVICFLAAVLRKTGTPSDGVPAAGARPVLVVVPKAVLVQWRRELACWMRAAVDICHGARQEVVLQAARAGELEVVLATAGAACRNAPSVDAVPWEAIVVDECHFLKNRSTAAYQTLGALRCALRFGLTGTPIQNSVKELFALASFFVPNFAGMGYEQFRGTYEVPILLGQRHSATPEAIATSRRQLERLQRLVDGFQLRREKALIRHQLPHRDEVVVFCRLALLQADCYERLLASEDYQLLARSGEPCDCAANSFRVIPLLRGKCCYTTNARGENVRSFALSALVRLQKLATHASLIRARDADRCGDDEARLRWERDRRFEEIAFGGTASSDTFLRDSDASVCGKMQSLRTLLQRFRASDPTNKVLLFSTSTRMLAILESFAVREGYTFVKLTGATSLAERARVVDSFQSSPAVGCPGPGFPRSLPDAGLDAGGGTGLNLTAANRVVIFDESTIQDH
eukprot:tig00000478_g1289.t1